jgi:hypothetical protein
MFQPFPRAQQARAEAIERPRTVRAAIMLMYAGAALSAAGALLTLVSASHIRTVIAGRFPRDTPLQVHDILMETMIIFIAPQVIAVALWAWMAWANGRGRNWARIVSAVLFGLDAVHAAGPDPAASGLRRGRHGGDLADRPGRHRADLHQGLGGLLLPDDVSRGAPAQGARHRLRDHDRDRLSAENTEKRSRSWSKHSGAALRRRPAQSRPRRV